jgi:hypothetical protein
MPGSVAPEGGEIDKPIDNGWNPKAQVERGATRGCGKSSTHVSGGRVNRIDRQTSTKVGRVTII